MPRPLNECRDCGATWYPRYRNLSRRCPDCGSRDVDIADEEFDVAPRKKSSGFTTLLAIITTPLLFIPCCGGCGPVPTATDAPSPIASVGRQAVPANSPLASLPANATIVGEWEAAPNKFMEREKAKGPGHRLYSGPVTVYRVAGVLRYRRLFFDGSEPLDFALVEGKTQQGSVRYHRADRPEVGERADDHMVIESDGALVHWDREGRIDHLRYVPTAKRAVPPPPQMPSKQWEGKHRPIARDELGDAWPLTVESGEIERIDRTVNGVALAAVVFHHGGKAYAVNGDARRLGFAPIDPLLKSEELAGGNKVFASPSPLLRAGMKLGD